SHVDVHELAVRVEAAAHIVERATEAEEILVADPHDVDVHRARRSVHAVMRAILEPAHHRAGTIAAEDVDRPPREGVADLLKRPEQARVHEVNAGQPFMTLPRIRIGLVGQELAGARDLGWAGHDRQAIERLWRDRSVALHERERVALGPVTYEADRSS